MRTTNLKTKRKGEAGGGLLEMLVGVAIVGVLMGVVVDFATNSLQAARKIAEAGEREDLRRFIRIRLDCVTTRAKNPGLELGQPAVLHSADGKPLGRKGTDGWSEIGDWLFKASGGKQPGELKITAKPRRGKGEELDLFARAAPLVCGG